MNKSQIPNICCVCVLNSALHVQYLLVLWCCLLYVWHMINLSSSTRMAFDRLLLFPMFFSHFVSVIYTCNGTQHHRESSNTEAPSACTSSSWFNTRNTQMRYWTYSSEWTLVTVTTTSPTCSWPLAAASNILHVYFSFDALSQFYLISNCDFQTYRYMYWFHHVGYKPFFTLGGGGGVWFVQTF